MKKRSLLAVDAGLRTGFALYGDDGRLCWYRSQHFGSMEKFKHGVHAILTSIEDLHWLVVEGGGDIAEIWRKEAKKKEIVVKHVTAEAWRERLLLLRERRSGIHAKKYADGVARQIIHWSGIHRPVALRHDTAEAILIGLWGVLEVKILRELPEDLKRF
jgi:hypothetical protein